MSEKASISAARGCAKKNNFSIFKRFDARTPSTLTVTGFSSRVNLLSECPISLMSLCVAV